MNIFKDFVDHVFKKQPDDLEFQKRLHRRIIRGKETRTDDVLNFISKLPKDWKAR